MQNMQVCYIGIHVPWWLTAFIILSSTLGISPNAITPIAPDSPHMHMNVHCSTVYNSKDLESTQMPIDDRLDWENVAHIHHGILCSNQK